MTAPTTHATPKKALDQRAPSRHDNALAGDRRAEAGELRLVKRRDAAHHTPDAGQCAINIEIVLSDALDREALIEARADFGAVEFHHSRHRRRGRLDIIDQKAGYAIVNDFRRRAGAESNDRRSAGHSLDHDEAERLGPIDRENERRSLA